MSASQMVVVPILGPGRFKGLGEGEVLQGAFEGHPLVSVHDPVSRRGGAAKLKRHHLDIDFVRLVEAIKREFGPSFAKLQIKFIVANTDEAMVKEMCKKHGLTPLAVAGVEENATLDVFFFAASGRLRIAPSAASFRETSKEHNDSTLQRKSKVLIVDDSKTMRALLRRIIEGSKDLEVVGEAERPSQVEELISKLQPDVMTLDINMPEMSGVQLLAKILAYRFIPTVMISAVTMNDGEEVLKALELGAVDYIHKPEASELQSMTPFIQEKVLNAARVRRAQFGEKLGRSPQASTSVAPSAVRQSFDGAGLIGIGASTGGTEAIKQIFLTFPKEIPPIVVVQHIPPYFSTAFANRLNELCKFEVREAVDGDEVRAGRALIAPGGMHMEICKERGKLIARLTNGDPVNRFKPSVDVMFNSIAKNVGRSATGVLLTGMGSDGAKGLLAMKQTGSFTIAQDEESSVVYGMPRAAFEIGAASIVEPLDEIPFALMALKAA
jgi:two-component system chemotaxis response regulator CheB